MLLAALVIMGNVCCWRSNKDTHHCLWAEILPSRGAQRRDTPRRGRLTYGAGLPGLAEQFLCHALMSGRLTLHAGMCSAVGLTVLQNASACMLMYAHPCCPPSPRGQVQLAVVPHRSSFFLSVLSPYRGSGGGQTPVVPAHLAPCAWTLCV